MDFLSVSGTGVPVERLFSTGADLLTARRLSMSKEMIKICICLKGWLMSKGTNFDKSLCDAIVEKIVGE